MLSVKFSGNRQNQFFGPTALPSTSAQVDERNLCEKNTFIPAVLIVDTINNLGNEETTVLEEFIFYKYFFIIFYGSSRLNFKAFS